MATLVLFATTALSGARPAAAVMHYLPSRTAQNTTYYGYFVTDVRCNFSFAYGNVRGVAYARVNLISAGCGGALVEVYGVVDDEGCCVWTFAEAESARRAALPPVSNIVYPKWSIVTPGYYPQALCFGYNVFNGMLDFVSYGGRIPAECR